MSDLTIKHCLNRKSLVCGLTISTQDVYYTINKYFKDEMNRN